MGRLADMYASDLAIIDDPDAYAESISAAEEVRQEVSEMRTKEREAKVQPSPAQTPKAAPRVVVHSEPKGSGTDQEAYQKAASENRGDPIGAIFRFCFDRNVFYHEKYAKACVADGALMASLPESYLDMVNGNPSLKGLTFFSQIKREGFEAAYAEELDALDLAPEDRKNRQQILSIVGYDPFLKEPLEDRPQMYRDLAGLLNDSMRRDVPKRNAAIEVVRDYATIGRYQRRMASLEMSGNDNKETREAIDNCIKMISKMQDTINKLTKENGFSSGKAIGASGRGGLSEVMSMCEEKGYDPGTANIYDIETSNAIQEVARISTEAMLNQVCLTGTDYAEILTAQCKKVLEFRDAAMRALEGMRIAESKLEKQAILEEYRGELMAKGIDEADILEILNQEIRMYDGGN